MRELKKDHVLCEYWSDGRRFADLFNGVMFHGKQVLKPEQLKEEDTHLSTVVAEKYRSSKTQSSISRNRDIIKRVINGTVFILLAIENQDRIHYAMPVRNLMYDALGYVKQCKKTGKEHANVDYEDTDEFLSKFKKNDRIMPIFTLTLYYGEKEWDGPKSLLDMVQIDSDMIEYMNDYKLNLVWVRDNMDTGLFQTEVRQFFQLMGGLSNLEKLHQYTQEHPDEKIDEETLLATAVAAKAPDLMQLAKSNKGKGAIHMCTAIEELKQEGRQEGETLFAKLTEVLLQEQKIQELLRATKDIQYRQDLYTMYNIR